MLKQTKIAWLSLTLLFLGARAGAGVAIPDWVRQAAAQPSATYSADTNAVVLLDDTEETVAGAGEYLEHHRRVVRILRPQGRDEAELGVPLDRQEKVLSVHAWSVDASGHEYEVKDKEFLDVSPYSDVLYSDFHVLRATAPAAGSGSLIGFEYTARRRGWLNQLDWTFQEDIPVREAQFSVQLPGGWEFKPSWTGAAAVRPARVENTSKWVVHDVPAIEREPRMPAFRSLYGRMEVAYFAPNETAVGSWEGLGRWYGGLTAGRRMATPEIVEKVKQLTADRTDFDGRVRSLASFLQSDVRYVAIEIGVGGFQPHPASDIFHARYGDCKDKATLLSSMLQEAGIRSDYLVINVYHGVVNPDVPSADSFNHVLLAIDVPAGVSPDSYL